MGAASKAFENWGKLPGHVRARHLYSVARHVQKHARYGSAIDAFALILHLATTYYAPNESTC